MGHGWAPARDRARVRPPDRAVAPTSPRRRRPTSSPRCASIFGSERGRKHQEAWDADLDGLEASPGPDHVAPGPARGRRSAGRRSPGIADRTGSITPGKKADIVIIDGSAVNVAPIIDPVGAVVCAADVSNVKTVLVDGEILKQDFKLAASLDAPAARTSRRRATTCSRSSAIRSPAGCPSKATGLTFDPRPGPAGLPSVRRARRSVAADGGQPPRVASPRTTAAPGRARRARTSRWPAHQSTGCSVTRSRRRPPEQRGHDLAQRPGAGELEVLVVVGDRQAGRCTRAPSRATPRRRRSSRSGERPAGRRRPRRTATRPGGRRRSRAGPQAPGAAAGRPPRRRGPGATGSRRAPCTGGRPSRRARGACRGRRPRPIVAGAPVAAARRRASSSIRGLKSTPTTSSAPGFQSDRVSRPPAHWRWIARRQRPCRSPIRSSSTGRGSSRRPGSGRPPRRTSPRTARRPRPRPPASRRASRARPRPPPAWRAGVRRCGLVVHGRRVYAVHGRPGHTEAVIHRTTAHRIVRGRAQNRPRLIGGPGLVARTAELSRRGCRSRGCPRGGWSPRSRLRAMRLRSPAAGGKPASAVASRALGPFASSSPGPPGDLRAGRRIDPRLSPRWQLPARAGRPVGAPSAARAAGVLAFRRRPCPGP